ncbi:hypothetical protein [Caballeronia sp. dw_19]|nr:hypothetical protein [Caballeronia sp. dw_19]
MLLLMPPPTSRLKMGRVVAWFHWSQATNLDLTMNAEYSGLAGDKSLP